MHQRTEAAIGWAHGVLRGVLPVQPCLGQATGQWLDPSITESIRAMSRTMRIRGMETGSMPSWEKRNMSIPTHHSMPTGVSIDAAAQDAFTAEGGRVNAGSAPVREEADTGQKEQARLMATLGIHHEGRYYHFRGYRYTRLEDAVAYAHLVGTRAARLLPEDNLPGRSFNDDVTPPTGQDTALMRSLGVSFEAGRYVYEGFHYDRLADAVAYARLRHSPQT